jgi:hypothetical protein
MFLHIYLIYLLAQAFLLGGSIDQTLGALAEDCARNACRNEAKEYFWNARVKAGKCKISYFVCLFKPWIHQLFLEQRLRPQN